MRQEREAPLSRRELLRRSLLLMAGGCLCRSAAAEERAGCCFTPSVEPEALQIDERFVWIDLKKAKSLRHKPSAAYVVEPAKGIQLIVVRRRKGGFVALSRLCTHARQVISFIEDRDLLQCNGYNHSTFELEGSVYKGPAEAALERFPVAVEGKKLRIGYRRPV